MPKNVNSGKKANKSQMQKSGRGANGLGYVVYVSNFVEKLIGSAWTILSC